MNAKHPLTISTKDAVRLFSRVIEGPGGCWLWQGALDHGYGRMGIGSRDTFSTHRLAYASSRGEAPAGVTIDHLCRVRHCINPEHLEAVSDQENILRGQGASAVHKRKTHCIRGHAFTPENTRIRGIDWRICRTCAGDEQRAYRLSHPDYQRNYRARTNNPNQGAE